MRLDVGCGHRAEGDVNVDPYTETSFHRFHEGKDHACKYWLIPNFVKADGQYLPFQDGTFDYVYCGSVMEHVPNPYLLLKELIRVSNDRVTLIVPHRFSHVAKMPCHFHYFNNRWFEQVLSNMPEVYHWTVENDWRGLPFNLMPLIRLPDLLTVKIRVGKTIPQRMRELSPVRSC